MGSRAWPPNASGFIFEQGGSKYLYVSISLCHLKDFICYNSGSELKPMKELQLSKVFKFKSEILALCFHFMILYIYTPHSTTIQREILYLNYSTVCKRFKISHTSTSYNSKMLLTY